MAQDSDRNRPLTHFHLHEDALISTLTQHPDLVVSSIPKEKHIIDRTIPISALMPIRLELAPDLIDPIVESKDESKKHPLLKDYLPGLRARIQNTMGIEVPGVQMRNNIHLQLGEYTLSFFEIPCSQGVTQKGCQFIVATERALEMIGIDQFSKPGKDPVTQDCGFWIEEKYFQSVDNKQHIQSINSEMLQTYPALDAYKFIVSHLEYLLNRHLDKFLGIQDVYHLLQKWRQQSLPEAQADFARHLQENPQLLATNTQLLQALLKSKIPLINPQHILAALESAQNKTGYEEKVAYLKHQLQTRKEF